MTPPPPATQVWDFAYRLGWALKPGLNVILEGATDLTYFRLAADRAREAHRVQLLGDGFHVVAGTADGPTGGTEGIMDNFPALAQMASYYHDPTGNPVYRLAVLLDDDWAGRKAANYLATVRIRCLRWRDVFLLQRAYPTDTREPTHVGTRVQKLNRDWWNGKLDCEVEDLLPHALIESFRAAEPDCFARRPAVVADRYHYEFAGGMKGALAAHVAARATADDLGELIRTIQDLRFLLNVNPRQGTPVAG